VFGAESILGPVGLMSSPSDTTATEEGQDKNKDKNKSEDKGDEDISVDITLDLLNPEALHLNQSIDEPVTSGGEILDDVPGGTN
jgi:hypothetical protein